jgi:hypothetical protein
MKIVGVQIYKCQATDLMLLNRIRNICVETCHTEFDKEVVSVLNKATFSVLRYDPTVTANLVHDLRSKTTKIQVFFYVPDLETLYNTKRPMIACRCFVSLSRWKMTTGLHEISNKLISDNCSLYHWHHFRRSFLKARYTTPFLCTSKA